MKLNELLAKYQKSYNENDFNQFAEIMVDSFSIGGNWNIFSAIEAFNLIDYPYLYDETKAIKSIKVNSVKKISAHQIEVNITRNFSNYTDTNLVLFRAVKNEKGDFLFSYFTPTFTPSSRNVKYTNASYGIDEDSFDKRKIRHIDFTKKTDGLKGNVYVDAKFPQYIDTINTLTKYLKKYCVEKAGFEKSINCYMVLEQPGYTTIYIQDGESYVSSINDLKGDFEKDLKLIREDLFRYTTHENVETNLHKNFGIYSINNRWYADGFSEYVTYSICKDNDVLIFNENFVGGDGIWSRKQEYEKYKAKDNLLDWAIDRRYQDVNPLVGEKYTYDNDSGQYGRALQFFIDFVQDFGEDKIREIHKYFLGRKGQVSQAELLNYMSEITGEDIKVRVSKY